MRCIRILLSSKYTEIILAIINSFCKRSYIHYMYNLIQLVIQICGSLIRMIRQKYKSTPHHFFQGLFFYVYMESPSPKNPDGPTPQAPNPINWKPQLQKPNIRPQPQTTINEQKYEKVIKNNPGKKYSSRYKNDLQCYRLNNNCVT